MIKHILVATDGSPLANKAIRFAAGMAKQLQADVTIIGVIDLASLASPGGSCRR